MRSMSLQVKFVLGTIGLVILLGLAVIILVQTILTQKLLSELQDKGVLMTKHVAGMNVDHILTENTLASQMLVNDYKSSDENIEYIFVLDSQGEVFVHTFEEGFPIDLKEANIVSSGRTHSIQPLVTEKGAILDIAVPILKGSAAVARVGISEEPVRKGVANIIRLIVGIIIAVVLVLGGGLTLVFATVITKPIFELTEVAKVVGGGNLERRVRVRTKDEIGQLGVTFNTMIEELEKTRDEIISAKEYTDNVLHSMNDTLLVVLPDGNIQAVNAATRALLGYEEKELVGQPVEKIFAGEELPLKGPGFDGLIKKGFVRNVEKTYLSKGGRKIPMLFSGSVMRDDDGRIQGIVCVARDITERKLAEDKIIQTTGQLKIEREALERKNIALREILDQIDKEKNTLKQQVTTNLEQAIIPTLLRLKESSHPSQTRNFEILEKDLREIVSPFLETLKNEYVKLSPRELEVCRLIKDGMTSKEIAEVLNLSPMTIHKYRELIRKKLGLVNNGTNLRTYLLSL